MYRKPLIWIMAIGLVFILSGCGTLDFIRGKDKKDTSEPQMSSAEMQNRINELEQQIQKAQYENEVKIARAKDENRMMKQQISRLQEENQRIKDRNTFLESQTPGSVPPKQKPKAVKKPPAGPVGPGKSILKIKILSGDGSMGSAYRLNDRLKSKGYKVVSIGLAPRSDFAVPTIYYSDKFKEEAEKIGSIIGKNVEIKPLTWSSEFSVIVVSGKK